MAGIDRKDCGRWQEGDCGTVKPIQLFRIDDRLIHGQVVIGWATFLKTKQIVLCDDSVSENEWEKELYLSIVPDHMEAVVVNVAKLAEMLSDAETDLSKTIILVNGPQVMEQLLEHGASVERVNVGGIHYKEGRRKYLDYLYLNEEEVASFRRCMEKGVHFFCQDVPEARIIPLPKVFQKHQK
ncbi:MAG TPA: PTS mannose/fructose/sorbose transporter subunit IIB [Caldithrix abyssi]|uniref:PTS mannose/fructose/sorbose transporter subunit IIB n=1 Tax=Caldithrix abyssi TaxID=187145 RepID=A0A7V5UFN2_CALAY|nr:PTS mannose/fructose/sorbose transporter subunit IIB [Caldithrix abyssi]